jgi:hypothetical protein
MPHDIPEEVIQAKIKLLLKAGYSPHDKKFLRYRAIFLIQKGIRMINKIGGKVIWLNQ